MFGDRKISGLPSGSVTSWREEEWGFEISGFKDTPEIRHETYQHIGGRPAFPLGTGSHPRNRARVRVTLMSRVEEG